MSFETNETNETIDNITEQNIKDAIKFAEDNPLPEDHEDFAEMKIILDKISAENGKLAKENRERFIDIVSQQIQEKISIIENDGGNAEKLRLLYNDLTGFPVPFFENGEPVVPIE